MKVTIALEGELKNDWSSEARRFDSKMEMDLNGELDVLAMVEKFFERHFSSGFPATLELHNECQRHVEDVGQLTDKLDASKRTSSTLLMGRDKWVDTAKASSVALRDLATNLKSRKIRLPAGMGKRIKECTEWVT